MRLEFAAAALLLSATAFAQPADVQWGPVQSGDNVAIIRAPGKVIPKEGALSVESARIQGRVTNILRREGEAVQMGDPLFSVYSAECVSLSEEKRVAQERGLDDLIKAAKAREQQLGLRVEGARCEILATHAGTIVKRNVQLGAAFNVGDELATVLDVGNLNVELDLPERDLASVKTGQPVRLEIPSYPGRTFQARVDRILPSIDPLTRTSKVRLSQVALPKGITMDALVLGEISIKSDEKILRVPTTALVFHQNRQYVVKKGPTPVAVPVEVVSETETESSVRPWNRDELKPTDEIAVKGAILVYNSLTENQNQLQ